MTTAPIPPATPADLEATIVIASKNRRDELAKAVESALAQAGAVEVIVIDDGSSDGTSDIIRQRFPGVRLQRLESSQGYIAARNLGASLARGRIIFSIDDDAVFSTPRIVQQTVAEFDDPRVGVVAIPYIDTMISPRVRQRAPSSEIVFATPDYRGTAHAVRRDVFLALGGYRDVLHHQCEEEDLCVRLYNAGYYVRLGTSDTIFHNESPKRNPSRIRYFFARNNVLFAWHNAPLAALPLNLAATSLTCIRISIPDRRIIPALRGIAAGFALGLARLRHRHPVRWSGFWLYRFLRSRGPQPLSTIEERLNALAAGSPLPPVTPRGAGTAPPASPPAPAAR